MGNQLKGVFKKILELVASDQLDKQAASDLINTLKRVNMKEETDIAVIGMAMRVADVPDYKQFWEVTCEKRDITGPLSDERKKDVEDYVDMMGLPEDYKDTCYGGYLNNIDSFDYEMFHISKAEAELMDPAQRLFLQEALHAAEDAGYAGESIRGTKTGIYVGFSNNGYYQRVISETDIELIGMAEYGNMAGMMTNRLSNSWDLRGPAEIVDATCASSIVAVDSACKALKNHECDMAFVSGIRLNPMPIGTKVIKQEMESPTYKARAFDDAANGIVIGEGVGVLLLKRLDDAVTDHDHIHSVIKAVSVNQDGKTVRLAVPNVTAQKTVILNALKESGISPEDILYIDAQGTGSPIGDLIEMESLNQSLKEFGVTKKCPISSYKTYTGHLFEASGIISIIRGTMALQNSIIPPQINYDKPNQKIKMEDASFYVNTDLKNVDKAVTPKNCGINTFGINGVNAHCILQEYKNEVIEQKNKGIYLFVTSAKNKDSLQELLKLYSEIPDNTDIVNLCFTASCGREHYEHRVAVIIDSAEDLKEKLTGILEKSFSPSDLIKTGSFVVVAESKTELSEGEQNYAKCKRLSKIADSYLNSEINAETLTYLADLYVKGADINWQAIYKDMDTRRIPLPIYPYKKVRCWLNVSDYIGKKQAKETAVLENHEIDFSDIIITDGKTEGTLLILYADHESLAEQAAGELRKEGYTVYHILDRCNGILEQHAQFIHAGEEVLKLVNGGTFKKFDILLDLKFFITSGEDKISKCIQDIFYFAFQWVDLLNEYGNVHINIISDDNLLKVHSAYTKIAEGLVKMINSCYRESKENNAEARYIYIDSSVTIDDCVNELKVKKFDSNIIYREGKRYKYIRRSEAGKKKTVHVDVTGNENGPYSKYETEIGTIWGKILKCEEVNIYDDFYRLGGDSILAAKIINETNAKYKTDYQIFDIFDYNTVYDFAKFIEEQIKNGFVRNFPSAVAPKKYEKETFYRLTPTQYTMFLMEMEENISTTYNLPSSVMLKGRIDYAKVNETFKFLIKRHEILRASLGVYDNEPVMFIHDNVEFDVLEYDLTKLKNKEANRKKEEIFYNFVHKFDISKPPLLRVIMIKMSMYQTILLYDIHHLILDGTSSDIIMDEFARCYNDKELEPHELEYTDYIKWIQEATASDVISGQKEYWRRKLENGIARLNYPVDFKRTDKQHFEGDVVNMTIETNLTNALKKLASDQSTTLFSVLLTAYSIALSQFCNQEDIVIATPQSMRNNRSFQRTVGFMLNMLLLSVKVRENMDIGTALQEISKTLKEALANQMVPIEEIVCQYGDKEKNRGLMCDNHFIFLNTDSAPEEENADLHIQPFLGVTTKTSQAEITTTCFERNTQLMLSVKYQTALFKKETIMSFVDQVSNVLNSMCKDLTQEIKNLT